MNSAPDKKLLAQQILELNDPGLIRVIAALLHTHSNPQTESISLEQYNQEITEAMQEIRDGKGIDHAEVKRILASR